MGVITLKYLRKRKIARDTWAFSFEKPAGFVHEAGQYVALVLPRLVTPDPHGPVRSLSIASAPCEDELLFAVRDTQSPYKRTFLDLRPGEKATVTAPVGHFTLSHTSDDKPIVFLIGGIGITPARSILVQAAHDHSTRPMALFYSNRTQEDVAFDQEIAKLPLPELVFVKTLTEDKRECSVKGEECGYIDAAMLRKYLSDDLTQRWYFIVGSPYFIAAMEKMLDDLGVAPGRRVVDHFTGMESKTEQKTKPA